MCKDSSFALCVCERQRGLGVCVCKCVEAVEQVVSGMRVAAVTLHHLYLVLMFTHLTCVTHTGSR